MLLCAVFLLKAAVCCSKDVDHKTKTMKDTKTFRKEEA